MDIDSLTHEQPALPSHHDGAAAAASGIHSGLDVAATPTNKRKFQVLIHTDAASSPPRADSSLPPSSPGHLDRSASSTPAPQFTSEAQKVYIARTAPHLLGRASTPSSSRTPSVPPSGRSSPTSDDGRSTPDGISSTPTPSNQSHHTLPEGYRGPALRKNDAEDFAPSPHLASTVGSATLFNTVNFAVNRNGWRYTAAGPASQHLRQTLFKTLETRPATVHWCWSDRSPFTKISADADIVSTDKGFRSARTNIGVREGEWYAEIEILPPEHLTVGVGAPGPLPAPMKDGAHIRLGWGRREAPLNAPVGFDGYSYGLRDKGGDKVTLSRPLPYGKPFKAGDVVGMYIKLPPLSEPQDENDPANIKRERIAIRYKGQLYFESLEYPRTREMEQLMERSRKGNSIEDALKGIEGTGVFEPHDAAPSSAAAVDGVGGANGNGGAAAPSTSTGGAGSGGGSAKVKNRKNPGAKDKPSGPTIPSLRPVPRLAGSKIGFFVNGEPQGIAFRDLFDFRPLRVKGFPGLKPAPSKTASTSRAGKQDAKKGEPTEPVINVKPRENVFDDGALGYFPIVSSYGGARARLITGEGGFRFPPPHDIEATLEAVSSPSSAVPEEGAMGDAPKWKPLHARFEEHLAEMWMHDLQDEAKAQALADKQADEKARRNHAAKERYAAAKKKHAAALARTATASPAPGVELEEEDGDRTVGAQQHEMHVDRAAWDGVGAGLGDDKGDEVDADTPGAGQHWSSSAPGSPEDQIRLVPSLRPDDREDVEMHDVASVHE
ncbi:related to BRE2-subunit of COMPASS (Set1C) complex [Sporisorium reilianum f. sp. reilianum]|uniref:Related to BRE2-subunit of COMPASS (Set1C) complex n=1 Tax=Sporisorium reilianum f. sp. reilianum TaxID=72559 RepID=A0A2N8U8M8_9BASI|nr:related to BRE2-subunit of COMPASS (Set1C) complex [Sporisorium reilianum f. sp. reilianum]